MEKMPPLIAPTAVPWNTLLFVFMAIKAPIMAPISAPTINRNFVIFSYIQGTIYSIISYYLNFFTCNTLKMTFSKKKL